MFAQSVGFGTDAQGLKEFGSSGNTLGQLGGTFVGRWFAILILVTAVMSAFASNLSSVATAARLVFALSRDGFGPKKLADVNAKHGSPRNAVMVVVAVTFVVDLVCYFLKWPVMGTGDAGLDFYLYFAVTGTTCLLFVYLLVEVAVFAARRRGQIQVRAAELILPALGGLFIIIVLWYGFKDQTGFSPAYMGTTWAIIGVIIAVAAPRLTECIGASLTHELEEVPGKGELVTEGSGLMTESEVTPDDRL